MNKKALFKKVVETLQDEAEKMENVLNMTHRAINDSPGAMQSHSDTTRFQSSGVAEHQTKSLTSRAVALKQIQFFLADGVPESSVICLGSVVEITDGNNTIHYLVLPDGGGEAVMFGDQEYIITTPKAPLMQQLIGRGKGATAEVNVRNQTKVFEVVNVL